MVMLAVGVLRGTYTQEKFEGVAEVVAVVAIESGGAVIDSELRAETDVEAFAVRQVAHVTERQFRSPHCPPFAAPFPPTEPPPRPRTPP